MFKMYGIERCHSMEFGALHHICQKGDSEGDCVRTGEKQSF